MYIVWVASFQLLLRYGTEPNTWPYECAHIRTTSFGFHMSNIKSTMLYRAYYMLHIIGFILDET